MHYADYSLYMIVALLGYERGKMEILYVGTQPTHAIIHTYTHAHVDIKISQDLITHSQNSIHTL